MLFFYIVIVQEKLQKVMQEFASNSLERCPMRLPKSSTLPLLKCMEENLKSAFLCSNISFLPLDFKKLTLKTKLKARRKEQKFGDATYLFYPTTLQSCAQYEFEVLQIRCFFFFPYTQKFDKFGQISLNDLFWVLLLSHCYFRIFLDKRKSTF